MPDRPLHALRRLFARPFWGDPRLLAALWLLLAVLAALAKMSPERCNNFLIFEGVFRHAADGLPLYDYYPSEYRDHNLYGPLFALLIAPFALLPRPAALVLWNAALAAALAAAVRALPGRRRLQTFVGWFCAHELLTALFMQQFNIAVAAAIVGAFALVEREKDPWAALLIMAGALVKIYPLAGLAFFFFSKHKRRFALWCAGWGLALAALPMLCFGPQYVLEQYAAWAACLADKNGLNADSLMQNISLLGMTHRITGLAFSDLWLMVPGALLFLAPYLRSSQWQHLGFRCAFLASALLFVVLFSSGSESSGYIIALTGAAVWYASAPWKRNGWDVMLMAFAFVLTSLSPSDLFPAVLRERYVQPYALKALPCVLVWFKLIAEMLTRDYSPAQPAAAAQPAASAPAQPTAAASGQ